MSAAREQAEVVALQALAWLAEQEDLLGMFLGSSGMGQEEVAQRAQDPEFLAAVLDFVLMDDAWVLGFARASGLPETAPMQARAHLPGGADPHWT